MSYRGAERLFQDWVLTKHPPKGFGPKAYYFDVGNSCGYPDDNGDLWYRLNCSYWLGDWIEANGGDGRWRAHGSPHRAIYIVREDLFMFIKLKWL